MAVSKSGEVVVVSVQKNNSITVLSREGKKIKSFGSSGSGMGQFNNPCGIVVTHDDHVVVVDKGNNRLQKFALGGEFMTSVGHKELSRQLQFNSPADIVIHPSGRFLVVDSGNHRIQVFNADLSYSHTIGNQEQLQNPTRVAVDSQGDVYVIDSSRSCLQKFTAEGKFITSLNVGDTEAV